MISTPEKPPQLRLLFHNFSILVWIRQADATGTILCAGSGYTWFWDLRISPQCISNCRSPRSSFIQVDLSGVSGNMVTETSVKMFKLFVYYWMLHLNNFCGYSCRLCYAFSNLCGFSMWLNVHYIDCVYVCLGVYC